ncbi:MAG TPA: hypothetical protein VNT26_01945 [Candidatus Sulfotelmatobacter sp.]|nr:hypothetical protein [Candidatus Sulfotelmatobacter sp.]
MSLINDALKRAKQAQQQALPPVSPGPQLRPVEPTHATRRGIGLLLPFGLGLVALLALFWLWQLSQKNVLARSAEPKPSASARQNAASPAETAPAASATSPTSATGTASNFAPAPAPLGSSATAVPAMITSNNPTAPNLVSSQAAQTNLNPIPAETLPPKPAPLKLQAIVFHPTRPSAMISGRPLFVGDRLGEFQVQAIGQESVTLVSGDKTNVLTLFQ